MFKQLIVVLVLAGVVLCEDQAEVASTTAKPKGGLGQGLLDLAIISARNAKRAYDDSKPTLDLLGHNLANTIRGNPTLNGIVNNPNVQKGFEDGRKRVESIGNKITTNEHFQAIANPIFQHGKSQFDKVLADHNARQEALKNDRQQ